MSDDLISDKLFALVNAIYEDKSLCERVLSLEQLPASARQLSLMTIAAEMRVAGEDSAAADAVCALAQPRLYAAVSRTLRESMLGE